jgi:DNA-binding NarL/FixJ family response regulator
MQEEGGERKTNPPIRVLLADDHTLFRRGLTELLSSYGSLEIKRVLANPKTDVVAMCFLGTATLW